jgi:hypothetical protein
MSLLTFTQTLGGAVMLTFGEIIFSNSLLDTIPTYAKSVDLAATVAVGAIKLRSVITDLNTSAGVLIAYSNSIDRVFYLAIGCSACCFLFVWEWDGRIFRRNLRERKLR